MTSITRPQIDLDHQSQTYREHWVQMAADLHATGNPIAWTQAHGGFWVIAGWDEVHRVGEDWESFTSYNDLEGTGNGGRGQLIPQTTYRLDLGESDPPLHTERRRLEAPFFTPKALRQWRPVVRRHLVEALNGVLEAGECDLMADVIIPTTSRTTLFVTGYGADGWKDVAAVAHGQLLGPTHPDFPMEQVGRLRSGFRDKLAQRRAQPTGDLISALATGTVQGRELSVDEGESMMNAIIFGGFDTAAATVVSALRRLDELPQHRDRLVQDEPFRRNFIEEVLRTAPTAAGMARTAVRDVEILGQHIAPGESVFMWLAAANRDPNKFPDPDRFDPSRTNASEHVTFSTGNHRCLGAPLAKVEIAEMLRVMCGVLADLQIDHDSIEQTTLHGGDNGYTQMRATYRPRGPLTLDEVDV
jgi:cytochrome P450